jgi:hypothetical protein
LLEENVCQLLAGEESDGAWGSSSRLFFASTLAQEGRKVGEAAHGCAGESWIDAGD